MFIPFNVVLTTLNFVLAEIHARSNGSLPLALYEVISSDDAKFKNIQEQFDKLRLKFDSLNTILDQERNEMKQNFEEIKASLEVDKKVSSEFKSNITELRKEMKKDFEEIKASLETVRELPREFISNITEYLQIQIISLQERNKIKKDLEEIKASVEIDNKLSSELKSNITEYLQNQSLNYTKLFDLQRNLIKEYQEIVRNSSQPTDKTQPMTPVPHYPSNCAEALHKNFKKDICRIQISDSKIEPFDVFCLRHEILAPWMIIQRRQDGSVDFYRNWSNYTHGFGNLEGEFFLGLDKLHALTQSTLHELWIQMEDFEGNTAWAKYSKFVIGGESENFALNQLGEYSGNAGDSLTKHAGMKWTTNDRDNDDAEYNTAWFLQGAWWYQNWAISASNLNGEYFHQPKRSKYGTGIFWHSWKRSYSLKYVHMAIRPVL